MEDLGQPLVSIGVPVYNGGHGLARALDSLLEQDYANLEIIISDNASTDVTADICRKVMQKDPRVKYFRAERNLGAIWNFNRVFELSSGKYFMWAAHDDRRERSFVSACVEKMEQCPEAVLCQAHTAIYVEGHQGMLCFAQMEGFEGIKDVLVRYRKTLTMVPATVIYGLFQASAMRKTCLFERNMSTDVAFIQEMSIYGPFVEVPKKLFSYFGRQQWNTVHQDYCACFGKKRKPWWCWPFASLFCNHFERVAGAPIRFSLKLCLWGVLIKHEIGQILLKISVRAIGFICPMPFKERWGCVVYWRWMHNPSMKVVNESLFWERAIKPKLGWWK